MLFDNICTFEWQQYLITYIDTREIVSKYLQKHVSKNKEILKKFDKRNSNILKLVPYDYNAQQTKMTKIEHGLTSNTVV